MRGCDGICIEPSCKMVNTAKLHIKCCQSDHQKRSSGSCQESQTWLRMHRFFLLRLVKSFRISSVEIKSIFKQTDSPTHEFLEAIHLHLPSGGFLKYGSPKPGVFPYFPIIYHQFRMILGYPHVTKNTTALPDERHGSCLEAPLSVFGGKPHPQTWRVRCFTRKNPSRLDMTSLHNV